MGPLPHVHAASPAARFAVIQQGQGLFYSSLSQTFRARNCEDNEYGVPSRFFGLSTYPCRCEGFGVWGLRLRVVITLADCRVLGVPTPALRWCPAVQNCTHLNAPVCSPSCYRHCCCCCCCCPGRVPQAWSRPTTPACTPTAQSGMPTMGMGQGASSVKRRASHRQVQYTHGSLMSHEVQYTLCFRHVTQSTAQGASLVKRPASHMQVHGCLGIVS
jgi:hypothetical protein